MASTNNENSVLAAANLQSEEVISSDVARLVIDGNRVIGSQDIEHLHVQANELEDGVDIAIVLDDHITIQKPVHLCFGMLPKKGIQKIWLNVTIGKHSKIKILSHCTFPNAVDIEHIMHGDINIKEGAEYSYFEQHLHSKSGGTKVIPHAKVTVGKDARFKTEFELLYGRVGVMDINYRLTLDENALADMTARINGMGDDRIIIRENAILNGTNAKGVLTSKVAVRDTAKAEVYNTITANAAHSRGHVDCKEIVRDNAVATAIPVVDVQNSKAHITHEAAVGDVDKKQLETLMARGLTEDQASEIIIQGMLS